MLKIIKEHPALFLGELREDLERITCVDENGNRHLFKIKGQEDSNTIETLVCYPNDYEYEIVE